MISDVSFKNFKSLQQIDLKLGEFMVLVGPNSCGKTSVLQGLHLLSQIGLRRSGEDRHKAHRPGMLFSGRWHPARLARTGSDGFALRAVQDGEAVNVSCRLPEEEDGAPSFVVEAPGCQPERTRIPGDENPATLLNQARFKKISSAVFLHLDAALMARPSFTERERPRVESDGEGLASFFNYLAGAFPDRKLAVEAAARVVIPRFRRVLVEPARISRTVQRPFAVGNQSILVPVEEEVWGHRMTLEMDGGARVPADMASEGTILALGLMALLHGPDCPRLVLLDDLDRALHLGAQVRLIRLIREIQRQYGFQLVATTHSPFMLQEVDGADIRVLSLRSDGATRCRPLIEHPDYDRWRRYMTPGEVWANVGEDWVDDGGDGGGGDER